MPQAARAGTHANCCYFSSRINGSCKNEGIEFEGGRNEEREKDDKQPEKVKERKVG